MLDLICVACHYSIRFNNSDDYVNNYSSHHLFTQNVFYLKDIQPIDMVNKFIDEYLQITSSSTNAKNILSNQLFTNKETDKDKGSLIRATQITWKNMQYLWKKFLDSKELPNIMFLQTLKNLLLERLNDYYDENMDSFIGICSEHLPSIQQFIQFWSETISIDDNEIDFEIDEIIIIFKQWCETKREISSTLNDKQILFWMNNDILPLMIHENYPVNNIKMKNEASYLHNIAESIHSLSDIDLFEKEVINSNHVNVINKFSEILDLYLGTKFDPSEFRF
jgi:hypothetical protein